tara:strand:- start:256 stop:495 length:240 start_codon:yes stop_codon:yes gene_type:complete
MMRLFDLIKRKLFREPPQLVDCVRDKEWYERKYGKEINKYMIFPEWDSEKGHWVYDDKELENFQKNILDQRRNDDSNNN